MRIAETPLRENRGGKRVSNVFFFLRVQGECQCRKSSQRNGNKNYWLSTRNDR